MRHGLRDGGIGEARTPLPRRAPVSLLSSVRFRPHRP